MTSHKLEERLLNVAVRRPDKRYIPLLIQTAELMELGFKPNYIIKCAEKYYDGRDLVTNDRAYRMQQFKQNGMVY